MRPLLAAFLALAALAGCGADGPPQPPEPRPETRPETRPEPGLTVTGRVEIGVTGGG